VKFQQAVAIDGNIDSNLWHLVAKDFVEMPFTFKDDMHRQRKCLFAEWRMSSVFSVEMQGQTRSVSRLHIENNTIKMRAELVNAAYRVWRSLLTGHIQSFVHPFHLNYIP